MRRGDRQRGFTLIELLVSVAVLALMILIVNEVLVSSVQTVRQASDLIRCNANARAVTDVFRADLTSLTKTGFLAITQGLDDANQTRAKTGQPALPIAAGWPLHDSLLFTTVGSYATIHPYMGNKIWSNAGAVNYGIAASSVGELLLYRQLKILGSSPNMIYGDVNMYDFCNFTLGMAGLMGRGIAVGQGAPPWFQSPSPGPPQLVGQFRDNIIGNGPSYYNPAPGLIVPPGCPNGRVYGSNGGLPVPLVVPPAKGGDIQADWPFLAMVCDLLTVEWTDGQANADGSLKWYSAANPHDAGWQAKGYADQALPANRTVHMPEFGLPLPAPYSGSAYCALWTADGKFWPRAVRIRYSLTYGRARATYEVLVDLGKGTESAAPM